MKNTLQDTLNWFKKAHKKKTEKLKNVQLGCILEEVSELLDSVDIGNSLNKRAHILKENEIQADFKRNPIDTLDALADIIVTCVGLAHLQSFDIIGALDEVNKSNFSKFEDGKPVFYENGKIGKGGDYKAPELEQFLKGK